MLANLLPESWQIGIYNVFKQLQKKNILEQFNSIRMMIKLLNIYIYIYYIEIIQ